MQRPRLSWSGASYEEEEEEGCRQAAGTLLPKILGRLLPIGRCVDDGKNGSVLTCPEESAGVARLWLLCCRSSEGLWQGEAWQAVEILSLSGRGLDDDGTYGKSNELEFESIDVACMRRAYSFSLGRRLSYLKASRVGP